MARIDQVKEEIAQLRFGLGLSVAAYFGITAWLVEKVVARKIPDVPGYVAWGALVLLALLVVYFFVIGHIMRNKIKELGILP